jgi:hypothetical protein
MFEYVHRNTGNSKTQHTEFENIPECLEVFTSIFLDFLNAANKEEYGEAAIDDLKEDYNYSKSSNITLKPENL